MSEAPNQNVCEDREAESQRRRKQVTLLNCAGDQ